MTGTLATHAQKLLWEHGDTILFALEKRIDRAAMLIKTITEEALNATGDDDQRSAQHLANIMADQERRARDAYAAVTAYQDAQQWEYSSDHE